MSDAIKQLNEQGQVLWLDNIERRLITSGGLAAIRDQGVTGVTSNPTIFEKAVKGSADYEPALIPLVRAGRSPDEILWELMLEDIRGAADVLRPVYDRTGHADGFVSIEVSPDLAMDTQKTIAMARDLWDRADRPNVMVKIPGTRPGLPAIRQMIGEGVNINVTLIFAVSRYDEVVDAFLSGLEDLRARGGDVSKVASVASFFVSRVDTKIDKILDAKMAESTNAAEQERVRGLLGKAGIANSKLAYKHFGQHFSGARWQALADLGAHPQRCLWASTSTKDPRYRDTMYVEDLIGPQTVDTVPPATLEAFRDHGRVERTLDRDVEAAEAALASLPTAGVDLARVTQELEDEGVKSFSQSFAGLLQTLEGEAAEIRAGRAKVAANTGPTS
ncbi:MAG: transaldolase [Candidatus Dormibacteraeota bacterium]|nr:transaldolase [Candidatus Dormibacteraeota bacterium]